MEPGAPAKELTAKLTLDAPAKLSTGASPSSNFSVAPVEVLEEDKVFQIKVTAQFGGTEKKGFRNSYASFEIEPLDDSIPWPKQIRVPIKARVVSKK